MSDKDHDFGSLVCIYAQILPRIREAGKKLGYAIAIHGTLTRDLDLLAVPWIEDASDPAVLVEMIADTVGGYVIGDRADERRVCIKASDGSATRQTVRGTFAGAERYSSTSV